METLNNQGQMQNYNNGNGTKLPGFIQGWAITALVFSSLRLLLAPLSIIGYFTMKDTDPLRQTVVAEIITHLLLATFGIWANIAILLRKETGYLMGKVYFTTVILSFILSIVQVSIMAQGKAGNNVEFTATIFGAAIAMIIRIVLVSFYGVAVKQYGKFLASEQRTM